MQQFCYNKFCIEIFDYDEISHEAHYFAITNFVLKSHMEFAYICKFLIFCYNKFCIEMDLKSFLQIRLLLFCYNKFCIEIMDRKPLCKYPFQFCYNKFCIEICICRIIQNVRCKFCYNKFCIEIQKTLISILKGVYFAITNFVLK